MGFLSSLFGKKKAFEVHNKVWMHEAVKTQMLMKELRSSQHRVIVIAFFDKTYSDLQQNLNAVAECSLIKSSDILTKRRDGDLKRWLQENEVRIIFAEHFPALNKEEEVLNHLAGLNGGTIKAEFYVSLDDPIVVYLSGIKLKELMEKMGMAPEEVIAHPMVDKAITNAQEKIQKKIVSEQSAADAKEWFRINLSHQI